MSGQGSPLRRLPIAAGRLCAGWLPVLLALVVAGFARPALAEELEARLRIAWGGGDARIWSGSIAMPRGELSLPTALGLEADEPGSIYLEQGELRIASPSERTYDGVDLTIRGPADGEVSIDLRGREGLDAGLQLRLPLRELVSEVQAPRLDQRGNRLVVRRAPGDVLRIEFDREHLVFETGETFGFQLKPHLPGLAAGASYTIRLRLSPARYSEEVWSQQFSVATDSEGRLEPLAPIELELPEKEGVYDLVTTVHPWQFTSAIRRPKPVLQRKLQLIVLAPAAPPAREAAEWNGAPFEIDPANPSWWDRLPRWSLSNIWPSFAKGAISHGQVGKREHLGRSWIELPVGGWQAYPMGIGDPGRPHLLEIEYPSDVPQRLGISILEPNAAGRAAANGLDSGVIVSRESTFSDGRVVKHRLLFWPRTESPLVLLTNRSEESPALFGKIRVLNGPRSLPPGPVAAEPTSAVSLSSEASVPPAGRRPEPGGGRKLTAYFDKPLFHDNFTATDALDGDSGRSLDDWLTYYQGGRRLIEYLQHMGYTGAIISASCEGSTLYPSRLLHPTPKYNNGAFFVSGQDPLPKDVLEMLMRLFDREGLTLIPAVQFATPLPALEALRRRGGAEAVGLVQVDRDGRPLTERNAPYQGLAPYYNPLHPAVQRTLIETVDELAQRYGWHSSYGGVALQTGPYSFARLPDERWGFDDVTVRAYQRETGSEVAAPGPEPFGQRADTLLGPQREQWIKWRAARMTALYRQMAAAAAAGKPEARFYLADVHLRADESIRLAMRPALPRRQTLDETLLARGIDLASLRKTPQIVTMRSRVGPHEQWAPHSATDIELNEADDIHRFYQGQGVTTAMYQHEPDILRLPQFDSVSPFGPDKTFTRLLTHYSASQAERRRGLVKLLAEGDMLELSEGGWMLPLGQEDALRDLFALWRKLPAEPFETVQAVGGDGNAADASLVVRRFRRGDRTWIYLLNNAPWPTTARLELALAPGTPMQSLATRSLPPLEKLDGAATSRWNVPLEAYDMAAVVFSAPEVRVLSYEAQAEPAVRERLRGLIRETGQGIAALQQAQPLAVPHNAGFEAPPLGNSPAPGWVFSDAAKPGTQTRLDANQPHSGGKSLRMENQSSIAWMRSEPLPPPLTGRISLLVWLRTADSQQPQVRLSLDYDHDGKHYYEPVTLGAGTNHPLRPAWSSYVFQFDELPTRKVSDLRVGVDVMTPGVVWVDDVQVFDSRFEATERGQLTKIIALANFYLEQDRLGECHQVLSGYWPRFLRSAVAEPPQVADLPPPVAPPAAVREIPVRQAPPPEAEAEEKPRLLERLKRYSPTKWLPFR